MRPHSLTSVATKMLCLSRLCRPYVCDMRAKVAQSACKLDVTMCFLTRGSSLRETRKSCKAHSRACNRRKWSSSHRWLYPIDPCICDIAAHGPPISLRTCKVTEYCECSQPLQAGVWPEPKQRRARVANLPHAGHAWPRFKMAGHAGSPASPCRFSQ